MYDKKFGQWVICWEKERRLKEWGKLSEEAREVRRLRREQKKQYNSLCRSMRIRITPVPPIEPKVKHPKLYILNSLTGFRVENI